MRGGPRAPRVVIPLPFWFQAYDGEPQVPTEQGAIPTACKLTIQIMKMWVFANERQKSPIYTYASFYSLSHLLSCNPLDNTVVTVEIATIKPSCLTYCLTFYIYWRLSYIVEITTER